MKRRPRRGPARPDAWRERSPAGPTAAASDLPVGVEAAASRAPGAGALLRAHGLRPKKSLGQNFLLDPRLARRIARASVLASDEAVLAPGGSILEIGPGLGALTRELLMVAERVVAIERDRDLTAVLRELFAGEKRLKLVDGDAAALDWTELLRDAPQPWVVVGNLPYSITGRLLSKVVHMARALARAVVMVQREVGDRLLSPPGGHDYGILTVFTQAAFSVERLWRVPAASFLPPPQVESVVLRLVPHVVPRAEETPEFARVVRAAFATRRKTLRNAWRALGLDDAEIGTAAQRTGVSLDRRAEELSVEDFARFALALRTGKPGD